MARGDRASGSVPEHSSREIVAVGDGRAENASDQEGAQAANRESRQRPNGLGCELGCEKAHKAIGARRLERCPSHASINRHSGRTRQYWRPEGLRGGSRAAQRRSLSS
jgi:hypothetical protein